MKYLTMTIPDDVQTLRGWLESIVARGQARRLAEELAVIHGNQIQAGATISPDMTAIRERGFAALEDSQVRAMMREPSVLVAVAEDVFMNGGAYWTQRTQEESSLDERVVNLRRTLGSQFPPDQDRTHEPATPSTVRAKSRIPSWAVSFATAAAILLAILYIPGVRGLLSNRTETAWGWQKTEELASVSRPADYFTKIADLADEWKDQQTLDASSLAKRITEFRNGCARVQLADHRALSDAQRTELLEKCRKWADKIDDSLKELERTGDTAKVRASMDSTVAQLSKTLREMAAKSQG